MPEDEIPLFPAAGWQIGTIPALDAIFIQIPFLAHSMQDADKAEPGRRYVFHTKLARELRDGIDAALRKMESAGPQGSPPDRH